MGIPPSEFFELRGTVRAKLHARLPFFYRRKRERDFHLARYLGGIIRSASGPADAFVSGAEDALRQSMDERPTDEKFNDAVRSLSE